MRTQVLQPGLLVSLKTGVRGGVNYQRVDIEGDHVTEEGARRARWETRREIPDPAEFEAAAAVRGKCRSIISAICCPSSFGLLCPQSRELELFEAFNEARALALAHNKTARLTNVHVFVLVGRVAQDDAEAARAISNEVRELLDAMREGIAKADPAAIREAANKARALGAMLSEDVAGKVESAIDEARAAAREIVKRVEKQGQQSAFVIEQLSVKAIESARFAFLDLDEGAVTGELPAGRALDLDTTEAAAPVSAAPAALALEF